MTEPLSQNGLIPAEDLFYLLGGTEKIKVLDATFASIGGMSPYQAFLGQRIEGAQFFDIDVVADQESSLPHMLPTPEYFADCVSAIGISNDDHIVVYDQSGAYMAASRVWWMFRTFGHKNVYVLEGGLQMWKARGFHVTSGPIAAPEPGSFKSDFRSDLVVSRNDVLDNIETNQFLLIDARAAGRYNGTAPEPRPGMRSGHIPKSVNLPFTDTIDPHSTYIKSDSALEDIFTMRELAPDAKLAVLCGSGVTACTLALALYKSRRQEAAIYDGSWSEWGVEGAGTPVEVSA